MDLVIRYSISKWDGEGKLPERAIKEARHHKYAKTDRMTACGVKVPEGDPRWKVEWNTGEEKDINCSRCLLALGKGDKPASKPSPKPRAKVVAKPKAKAAASPSNGRTKGTFTQPAPKPEPRRRRTKPATHGLEYLKPDGSTAPASSLSDSEPEHAETSAAQEPS